MEKGIKGFFLPLPPHPFWGAVVVVAERLVSGFLVERQGRGGGGERRWVQSSTDWEGRVGQQPHPHTLGGDTRCQTPPTVALALTVLKKLLCVQTHFAVTQLWL